MKVGPVEFCLASRIVDAVGFPHGPERITGSSSQAVSRAQAAGAAAGIPATGFYLALGGRTPERRRRREVMMFGMRRV